MSSSASIVRHGALRSAKALGEQRHRKPHRKTCALAVCLLAATVFLHTRPARGGQEEWVFSIVPQTSMLRAWNKTYWGGGLSAGLEYGFTDSLGVRGFFAYNAHAATHGGLDVLSVILGGVDVIYTVDILRIIPYLLAGVEGAGIGGGTHEWKPHLGVRAGAGMDYLLSRTWSLGVEISYHLFVTDIGNLPALLNVGFRIGRRWY